MNDKIKVTGHINASINFAMQQNYVPIIRNIRIVNESEETLKDLKLKITCEPGFAREYVKEIEDIEPKGNVEISPINIKLSTEFLFSLTEKMVGEIFIELYSGEEKIYEFEDNIELLAYDEWSGLLIMPEIISAFVTPNHPVIARVIASASKFLEKWSNTSSFTGYQTRNPNNVKLQMAALYAALQSEKITYNNPPASYEVMGQRVRLPHVVLEQKQGTCLDLSVLYATCLEAVGLFPLIIFIEGHAYAGCWLEEQTFADCAVDDVSAIEKRIVAGSEEILLVECTDFTNGVDFEKSLKHGVSHLDVPTDFDYVIDIQRSRGSGIRPIPVRIEQAYISENGSENTEHIAKKKEKYVAPKELSINQMEDLSAVEEKVTKQKVWERKLLDFSLRNALLNFRPTKNTLQLMVADMGQLEDKLADGTDFRVMEMPSEWTLSVRDVKMYEIETQRDLIQNIATEEFKSNRIRTFINETELIGSLKSIYRAAKVSIEENGTNTLYLALGFLRWFESDLSEKPRYAPIVLLPIDIVKNSKNKGYIIRSRQEDAQINITLLEYLKQIYGIKINGLDPLPTDDHGIDLPLVYHTIRQAIMGQKRWNIESMAIIGLFSFGQFVMWNDIRNRSEELKTNKVVSSLMDGCMNWNNEDIKVTADSLDATLAPHEMAIPMSADSSQMVAIAAAASGESFVLHGPPGTGKSQTITNMIANALYQGKSVLFVAEKMAALNVVQNRLASIGLDPFCLELHSNKTNKSSVLGQLNKALEVGRIKAPEEYKLAADKIHEMRKNLNSVIEGLHCKREFGKSLYDIIKIYEECSNQRGNITWDNALVDKVTKEQIDSWNDIMREFVVALGEVKEYSNHPLLGYEGVEYTIELRDEVCNSLKDIISHIENVKETITLLCKHMGIDYLTDRVSVEELSGLGDLINGQGHIFKDLILSDSFDIAYDKIVDLSNKGNEYSTLYKELTEIFNTNILKYDSESAWMRWKKASISWFLPKLLGQNKLVKEMKLYANNQTAISKENIEGYYEKLTRLRELEEALNKVPSQVEGYINSVYMNTDTNWDMFTKSISKTKSLYDIVNNVADFKKPKYVELVIKNDDSAIVDNLNKIAKFYNQLKNIADTYSINLSVVKKETIDNNSWLDGIKELFAKYIDNINILKDWVVLQQKINVLKDNNLACVVDSLDKGAISCDNAYASYECNMYYSILLSVINKDERLAAFQGKQYEDIICRYKELIEEFRVLTIKEVVAKLSEQIPMIGAESSANSEVGILKKAIKSNGRMLSIRKLFNDIPTLLRKLCPCMLMSPISVAQYIDPSFPKFDLVIFDEASQLPTSEAVGTIARGDNVIVVGDPKQLPPTSFFSSNRMDEENMDKEDLESLLDDCLAISMPEKHLKWHYRSRHESLIAYSNMQYYENKLYTFPSPNDLVSEVKYVPVEGFYDKGRSKHNKAEARAVVDEIIRRLKDEKLKKESIGVVTFSSVQQNLIDDMLSEEFVKYPELEEYDKSLKEPLFIKNLENVQGDERDVILFSIGYGTDKDGKVSMNFGPLNREGGWRRLNVAISRARKTMIVYSTLRPEQIDLSRTRSDGVAGLKGFLEFAARGNSALSVKAGTAKKAADSLAQKIAQAIENLGYEVRCNIGCSEYKMDIGVVNKNNPNTYMLGILLDGENCYNAATSKDRFVLQPNVLNSLGWNIIRVWTLEWLDNPDKVIQEIGDCLEECKNQSFVVEESASNIKEEITFEKMDEEALKESISAKTNYEVLNIETIGTSDAFYITETLPVIAQLAQNIINKEAPISRKALIRKILSAWGITRSGARVESIIDTALKHVDTHTTKDMDNIFYWNINQIPVNYQGYRVEDNTGNKRSMDDIVSYEIINAINEVLELQIALTKIDLIRETAKKFGYTRLGSVIETSIGNAIDIGVKNNVLEVVDGEKIVKK